jgi:hypothetical protein
MDMSLRLTRSMDAMLDWFDDQPCACATVGHIADGTGYSRDTVRGNLKQLVAAGAAEVRHESTGTYRLLRDPRRPIEYRYEFRT